MRNRTADQLEAALNGEQTRDNDELSELVNVACALHRLSHDAPSERSEAALAQLRGAVRDARQQREQRAWPWNWTAARLAAAAATVAVLIAAVVIGTAGRSSISEAVQGLFAGDTNTKIVGVISEITGDRLVVQADGKTVVVVIEERTLVTDASNDGVDVSQLSVGQTIEVKGEREQDGVITASRVKIAADGTQPGAD
jgi:hypothetical protein